MLHEILTAFEETILTVLFAAIIIVTISIPISLLSITCYTFQNRIIRMGHFLLHILINLAASIPYFLLLLNLFFVKRFLQEITLYTAFIPLIFIAIPGYLQSLEKIFQQPLYLQDSLFIAGVTRWQFVLRVVVPETRYQIMQSIIFLITQLIGYVLLIGILGRGGIGDLLFDKGYKEFDGRYIMWITVFFIVFMQILSGLKQYIVYLSKK